LGPSLTFGYPGHIDLPSSFLQNLFRMELLLNLTWLLLALPAYWLWRRSFHTRTLGKLGSLQCLLALACLLVLLFPVISATDDLRAMRTEMEESSPGKRSARQAAGEKTSVWHSRWQTLPAVVAASASFALLAEGRHKSFSVPQSESAAPLVLRASRAPPQSCLA
jgi:HAMP domain-containing protein